MNIDLPKLPDNHGLNSFFSWLYEVKAVELGLDPQDATAKGVQEFSSFWYREVAPKMWEVIQCLQKQSSPMDYLRDNLYLWSACGLDKVAQCKRSACGRFFFLSKRAQKYCNPKCREQDKEEQYDTDAYREEKKLAMRRRRAALKALREAKFKTFWAAAK